MEIRMADDGVAPDVPVDTKREKSWYIRGSL